MSSVIAYWAAGVLAIGLAAIRVYAWMAVGLAVGARRAGLPVASRTALALVAGACLTMAIYAGLTAAGMIGTAIALDAAVAVVAIVSRRRGAAAALGQTARLIIPDQRFARAALVATLAVLVIVAAGPPRDADVMHYHLAHIRQIIAEGRWRQVPVCSFGIPFGWSLTFLPFEKAGLPQVAHFLNLGAWLTTCAVCVETAGAHAGHDEGRSVSAARWLLLCLTLLPVVLKTATTAMADAFLILVVALALALLARLPTLGRSEAFALGFAACAGLTSRYQAAAVAIAVTSIVLVRASSAAEGRAAVGAYIAGAAIALVVAAPFYVANHRTFGSPAWPFGAAFFGTADQLAHAQSAEIARTCASIATAGGDWRARVAAASRLIADRTAFPIPILVVVGCGAAVISGRESLRRIGVFGAVFVGVWAIAQPGLAPRFSLYLLPAAVMCIAPLIARYEARRAAPGMRAAGAAVACALAVVAVVYARDYLRLAATGDTARFHRATWYWPAYDWANRNTPPQARFAVILYGGHTYPLDRWKVSGDPGSSAEVPWTRIATGSDFTAFLDSARVTFVFYGPNVWTDRPMNDRIARVMSEAVSAGALDTVQTFRVPIVYSRIADRGKEVDLVLLRRKR